MWIALLLVGLGLIILNVRSIKKDKNSFKQILNVSEDNLGDFALQLGELRKEFAETILELQGEIEELKEKMLSLEDEHKTQENLEISKQINEQKSEALNNEPHSKNNSVEVLNKSDIERYVTEINKTSFNDSGMKTQQIQTMLSEGYSVDEISEKLNIGKGEVILIKDLYIK